jgi:hypothetical protein
MPDLYLYSIKIQTNINQNAVKTLEKSRFFLKKFYFIFIIFLMLNPARPIQLG